jgi:hypothetical protein
LRRAFVGVGKFLSGSGGLGNFHIPTRQFCRDAYCESRKWTKLSDVVARRARNVAASMPASWTTSSRVREGASLFMRCLYHGMKF